MSDRETREADEAADRALPPEPDGPLVRVLRRRPLPDLIEIGYRNDGEDEWGLLMLYPEEVDGFIADLQMARDGKGPVHRE